MPCIENICKHFLLKAFFFCRERNKLFFYFSLKGWNQSQRNKQVHAVVTWVEKPRHWSCSCHGWRMKRRYFLSRELKKGAIHFGSFQISGPLNCNWVAVFLFQGYLKFWFLASLQLFICLITAFPVFIYFM